MLRDFAIAGALAAGLAFSPAAVTSASAAPLTKSPFAASVTDNLILARQDGGRGGFGGGGFNRGGGGGGSFSRSGGGGRSFSRGGGGFSGDNRSFNRGSVGGSPRSFSRNRQAFSGGNLRRGNNWNGGKNWGGRGHRHHRRFYGGGFGYYPYYGASYYDGYDSGYSDCGWLLRRAENTGSSYWYRRYEECVSGY